MSNSPFANMQPVAGWQDPRITGTPEAPRENPFAKMKPVAGWVEPQSKTESFITGAEHGIKKLPFGVAQALNTGSVAGQQFFGVEKPIDYSAKIQSYIDTSNKSYSTAQKVNPGSALAGDLVGETPSFVGAAAILPEALSGEVGTAILRSGGEAAAIGATGAPEPDQTRLGNAINYGVGGLVGSGVGKAAGALTPKWVKNIFGDGPNILRKSPANLPAAGEQFRQEATSIGVEPTLGQLTKDPTQLAKEKSLLKTEEPLRERITEQHQALRNYKDKLVSDVSHISDKFAAGDMTGTALQEGHKLATEKVSTLYHKASEMEGRDTLVPQLRPDANGGVQDFADNVFKHFKDYASHLDKPTLDIFGEFQPFGGKKPLTIEAAQGITESLNKEYPHASSGKQALISSLNRELYTALDTLGDTGSPAAQAWKAAREARIAVGKVFGQKDLIQQIISTKKGTDTLLMNPGEIVDTALRQGKVAPNIRLLQKTLNRPEIPGGKEAWLAFKGAAMERLLGPGLREDKTWDAKAFANSVKQFGRPGIEALLGEDAGKIHLLERVGTNLSEKPYLPRLAEKQGLIGSIVDDMLHKIPAVNGASKYFDRTASAAQLNRILNPSTVGGKNALGYGLQNGLPTGIGAVGTSQLLS